MNSLKQDWIRRSAIIVFISIAVCFLMYFFEYTQWAADTNTRVVPEETREGPGGMPPKALLYILPFIKVFIFTGIPMLLTIWIHKFIRRYSS